MIGPTPASVLSRYLPLVGALLVSACADAKSPIEPDDDPSVSATTLVEGLNHPWSLAFVPGEADDEWLISERGGDLRRVVDGKLLDDAVTGVPEVVAKGQGGLFDVVPHPHFADNRRLYISYAKACDGGATTAVGHGLYADGELEQFQDVFIADACTDTAKHFGGRILF
ncbi:MAG: PQQ-dependent sugar dehydrogenase, partial [Alloalcanivorax venustensis]